MKFQIRIIILIVIATLFLSACNEQPKIVATWENKGSRYKFKRKDIVDFLWANVYRDYRGIKKISLSKLDDNNQFEIYFSKTDENQSDNEIAVEVFNLLSQYQQSFQFALDVTYINNKQDAFNQVLNNINQQSKDFITHYATHDSEGTFSVWFDIKKAQLQLTKPLLSKYDEILTRKIMTNCQVKIPMMENFLSRGYRLRQAIDSDIPEHIANEKRPDWLIVTNQTIDKINASVMTRFAYNLKFNLDHKFFKKIPPENIIVNSSESEITIIAGKIEVDNRTLNRAIASDAGIDHMLLDMSSAERCRNIIAQKMPALSDLMKKAEFMDNISNVRIN